MSIVRRRILISAVAAIIAICAFLWWQSTRPVPGEIVMGEESSTAELIALPVAVLGAITALFNALTAFFKMRSEKSK